MSTILLLLSAPSTIENNDNIFIDILINTINGIKLVDYNSKCNDFQKKSKLNEIFNIIEDYVNFSCCPGSCLFHSYKLLLEKREEKKIFLITDGFVTNKYEIELALYLINKCQNENIDLITIGVGSFPNGLDKIYPKFCYSPSLKKLHNSLSSCLGFSKDSPLKSIEPIITSGNYIKDENEWENIKKKLSEIIKEEAEDKILKKSIESKPILFYNMILNEKSALFEEANQQIENPKIEPYRDNIFEGYLILIVSPNPHILNINFFLLFLFF
jgi:hypothetical protein